MENSLLIGLSRQMTLRQKMNVIANNMANVNTSGYKQDNLLFEEFLAPVARMNDVSGRDARLSFVLDPAMYRNFDEGDFVQTGNDLDVAISGDAWFVVQTDDGDRYTRNGEFKTNADGVLTLSSGEPVLGEGGPITFAPNESGILIAGDGTISTNLGQRGKLRLVTFENNNVLRKEGALLMSSEVAPQPAENPKVAQGMVEKSNVQPVVELTRMIDTLRAYTSITQTLQKTQELRQTAIERLGGANGT